LSAKTDLDQAATNAVNVISQAALEATKVIAAAAAEATRIRETSVSSDHDILIELRTQMIGIKADIKELKDGTAVQIGDHEHRLTNLEESRTKQTVLVSLGVGLLTLLTSLLTYHIMK